ncbi:MAG TPA: TetR/AcrR family transcriptional regulator [Acidimicrobiales bacterium]
MAATVPTSGGPDGAGGADGRDDAVDAADTTGAGRRADAAGRRGERAPGHGGSGLPQRRHRRLDPATRRAQILGVAAEVYRDRDPAEVRFDEIAAAAGVSRSLVYAYFGDRGGLMAAVYLHSLQEFDAQLSELLGDVPVDEERFTTLVRSYLRLVEANAATWRLFAAAGALKHPEVQRARRARTQRIAEVWGGDEGAQVLATALVGLLEAGATEWLATRSCSLDEATTLLAQAAWNGWARIPVGRRR